MAASLPISTPVSLVRSGAAPGRAHPKAPSVWLSLAFVLAGLISLFIGVVWLLADPTLLTRYHYGQSVIAVTHLFVLGWICSIVMGSMYQLVPVALETKLYSERLARCQFAFHIIGLVGMVWMFRVWDLKQLSRFGMILAAGVALFIYNIGRTLWRAPHWTVTACALSSMLAWISLTVLAGLSIALGKVTAESPTQTPLDASLLSAWRELAQAMGLFDPISAMHAHAHLGGVGVFTILIVGVSYKLVPMFTLSEIQSRARAVWSIGLLNVGLVGSFVTVLLGSSLKPVFALIIATALGIYGWELIAILGARKRRALDWGIKYFLSGLAALGFAALLAVILSFPGLALTPLTGQLENLYGFAGFLGALSLAIFGMLYKVIPFLVWFGRYSSKIGRFQVPTLADLYSAELQAVGFWSYWVGLLIVGGGIVSSNETAVQTGLLCLLLSLATLALNVGKMLSHFVSPRLKPLDLDRATSPKPALWV